MWVLFGTSALGLAIVSFYVSLTAVDATIFDGGVVDFGYHEFSIVTGISAALSYATAYRFSRSRDQYAS